jgi:hypothetical protein
MKVVKPTAITPAMLVSTTAVEAYADWAGATAYVVGNHVIRTTTERIYERLVAGTTATVPESDATNWLDLAPSNKWALFDSEISTQTNAPLTLTVVIKPGYVNSLALFGMEGKTLTVTVRDALAGAVVYSHAHDLDGTILSDWYMYFFEPYVQLADLVLTDLPPYGDAHITINITGPGTVKCGILAVGTAYTLGDTQLNPTVGIIDYSRKDTDAFGGTVFTRRSYSKRMSIKLMLDNAQLNKVQRVLADLRATPCAWIGVDGDGYAPLTLFGFYRDFSIDVAYPMQSYCSVEVEGLI